MWGPPGDRSVARWANRPLHCVLHCAENKICLVISGVSTFLGIVVTAFSESELFHIFFRILFGIVVLGLLHGLLFLPVLLNAFCPSSMSISHSKEEEVMLPNNPEESPTEAREIEICEKETTV